MSQIKWVVLSGSLRQGSYNTQLAHLVAHKAKAFDVELTVVNLAEFPLPLFDQDIESQSGAPEAAVKLKQLIVDADVLVFASPEYNGSISGVLKNAIDWVSRAGTLPKGNPFAGKYVGLVAASTGALGGLRGLNHVRDIMYILGAIVLPNPLAISKAHEAFTSTGQLKNEYFDEKLAELVADLAAQSS